MTYDGYDHLRESADDEITPALALRIADSAIMNNDTIDDLTSITIMVALETRKTQSRAKTAAMTGRKFDDRGNLIID